MESTTPEEKVYSLKAAETNLLRYIKQHQEAIFAGILSTIATDRLAYHVTPNTKFELTGDFAQMKLTEVEPEPQAQESTEAAIPVVAAPEAPKE